MNILIPMAGAGQRFIDEGYAIHKPAIPTINRHTGKLVPMVVCAVADLPGVTTRGDNLIFVDRDFHKRDGVEEVIQQFYPLAKFLTLDSLSSGQATTCLYAQTLINNTTPLLIAGCDNGMQMDSIKFENLKTSSDFLVFTYRNNGSVLEKPNAYGWVITDRKMNILDVSVKKAISTSPMNDHAIVATFWFRQGSIFVESAKKMIAENDRVNNEFYVDQVIKHAKELGYSGKAFEIERYLGFGTPKDYKNYMDTIRYWQAFLDQRG